MNGYWDAVLGAALALPGTARPGQGPRPLADGEDQGLPVETEDFRDAPLPRASQPAAARPTPPAAVVSTDAAVEPAFPAPVPTSPVAASPREVEPERGRPAPDPPPAMPGIDPIAPYVPQAADGGPARVQEAPKPIASEPVRAEPARDAPLKAIEPPSPVATATLPPSLEDRPQVTTAPPPAAPPAEPATVPAEPLATLAHWIEKADERAAPPMLTIEIGRIDVRVESSAAPPTPIAAKSKPRSDAVPSLADYLARRSEAGR